MHQIILGANYLCDRNNRKRLETDFDMEKTVNTISSQVQCVWMTILTTKWNNGMRVSFS